MEKNKILTSLPIHNEGRYKGKIDWKRIVGMELKVLYNGDVYSLKIISFNKTKKDYYEVFYNGNIYEINRNNLSSVKIGFMIGIKRKYYDYEIGKILKVNSGKIRVVEQIKVKNTENYYTRGYIVECLNCKINDNKYYSYEVSERWLRRGSGCPCCANKVAVLGINTIWDTDRWMVDLGVSEEDAKKYTPQSHKKIEIICPDCGKKITDKIKNIYNRKNLKCTCGDGFSYPEKFMMSVLNQLDVEFITQYNTGWSGLKNMIFISHH